MIAVDGSQPRRIRVGGCQSVYKHTRQRILDKVVSRGGSVFDGVDVWEGAMDVDM